MVSPMPSCLRYGCTAEENNYRRGRLTVRAQTHLGHGRSEALKRVLAILRVLKELLPARDVRPEAPGPGERLVEVCCLSRSSKGRTCCQTMRAVTQSLTQHCYQGRNEVGTDPPSSRPRHQQTHLRQHRLLLIIGLPSRRPRSKQVRLLCLNKQRCCRGLLRRQAVPDGIERGRIGSSR